MTSPRTPKYRLAQSNEKMEAKKMLKIMYRDNIFSIQDNQIILSGYDHVSYGLSFVLQQQR